MTVSPLEAGPRPGAASARTRTVHLSAPLMNMVGAGLLMALAVCLWLGAEDIDSVSGSTLGPAGFPRLVAALLGLGCLVLLLQSGRDALARSGGRITVSRPFHVLAAVVLVCAYPPLIGTLGYHAATVLWMVPFLLLAGMRRLVGIAASVAGFLLFTEVLFVMVLGIPLP